MERGRMETLFFITIQYVLYPLYENRGHMKIGDTQKRDTQNRGTA